MDGANLENSVAKNQTKCENKTDKQNSSISELLPVADLEILKGGCMDGLARLACRKILQSHPLPGARNALTVVMVCIVHMCGCVAEAEIEIAYAQTAHRGN